MVVDEAYQATFASVAAAGSQGAPASPGWRPRPDRPGGHCRYVGVGADAGRAAPSSARSVQVP